MKTIILVTISMILTGNIYAQWQWSNHFGSYTFNHPNEYPTSTLIVGSNNFIIGGYGGTLFMPNDTLFSNGDNDLFITKCDLSGNQLWSKTIGGNFSQTTDSEYGFGVFDSISNCIYISGQVIGTVNFGSIVFNGSTVRSDIFVAKMDLNGDFIWVKKGGSSDYDRAKPYINLNGKIYVVAQTKDSSQFGSYNLPPGGALVQYDSAGNCTSAQLKFTEAMFNNYNEVKLNFIDNDLFYYGRFGTSSFQLDTAILTNNGTSDAFLARADSNGNVKWLKQFGNTGADYIEDMAISNNYLYAIGGFQDSINFSGTSLFNNGKDVFITKFDTSGNTIWARNLFCTGSTSSGNKIVVDNDGNTYVTGSFSGTATFGNFQITTTNTYDMFLARYDSAGNCLGVKNFGQASGNCLATDSNGDVVVAGTFNNTVTIGSNTFTSYGGKDVFLAKSDAITGLEEPERSSSNQLIIYANPNAGKCNITVPEEFVNESYLELTIFDNSGRTVQKKILEMNDGTIKVDLEAQAKGVYSITLGNGKRVFSGKMVIE